MAKVTIKNTRSGKGNISHQGLGTIPSAVGGSFLVDFQEFSQNLHVFRAKDCDHELLCEMVLEVKESLVCLEEDEEDAHLAKTVACSFPVISLEKLDEKVGLDAYLQGILMFQFQLKILEQLFLFCEQKEVIRLILTIHDANIDYLEIYSRFFISQEHVTTPRGERIQIVIPTDADTYDKILDFMDELDKGLRKVFMARPKHQLRFFGNI